ncbi:MAG: hypothetical protein LDL41_06200 [Coleofasciculus sp. S288]|nr:hypothetical protein [Coleofasciculus sp. S288]
MSGISDEQSLISNKFGTISQKQVIFLSNKGLFSSPSQEEIPIKQIESVRFYKQKSIGIGILGILGIVLPFVINIIFSGSLMAKIGGLVVLVLGSWIAYLGIAGIPTVVITKAGGTVTQASGWPGDRNEAKAFALVLRQHLKI